MQWWTWRPNWWRRRRSAPQPELPEEVVCDPDDVAWDAEILSPCTSDSHEPDRIVFSISGPFGDDEGAWSRGIEGSLTLIWAARYPSAKGIVLVPVVGGPSHRDCTFDALGHLTDAGSEAIGHMFGTIMRR